MENQTRTHASQSVIVDGPSGKSMHRKRGRGESGTIDDYGDELRDADPHELPYGQGGDISASGDQSRLFSSEAESMQTLDLNR